MSVPQYAEYRLSLSICCDPLCAGQNDLNACVQLQFKSTLAKVQGQLQATDSQDSVDSRNTP